MPLVQVWKCPKTGKLFERKEKYLVHLKKLARVKLEEVNLRLFQNFYDATISETLMRSSSFEEIAGWFTNEDNAPLIINYLEKIGGNSSL